MSLSRNCCRSSRNWTGCRCRAL